MLISREKKRNTNIKQTTLQTLTNLLDEHGKKLLDYGLPTIERHSTEVEHEIQRWAPETTNMKQRAEQFLSHFITYCTTYTVRMDLPSSSTAKQDAERLH